MIAWIRDHLVPEARAWWLLWSTWFNIAGLAILGWIQIDPVSLLAVWNMMPAAVTRHVPPSVLLTIGTLLFVLSAISRFVRQPKVQAKVKPNVDISTAG